MIMVYSDFLNLNEYMNNTLAIGHSGAARISVRGGDSVGGRPPRGKGGGAEHPGRQKILKISK